MCLIIRKYQKHIITNILKFCSKNKNTSLLVIDMVVNIEYEKKCSVKLAIQLGDALDNINTSLIDYILSDYKDTHYREGQYFSLRYHDLIT